MAEAGENWEEGSEEDTMIKIIENLSLKKALEQQSAGEETALIRKDCVELPCGHRRPAHYILAWFKHCLKQRQAEFSCPAFDEGRRRTCGATSSYRSVCGLIPLSSRQRAFLEENLAFLAARQLYDFKACPGCKTHVERRDKTNLCVHCTVCTASRKHKYYFCWSCRSQWKGPTHNAVRCGNSGCGQTEIPGDPLVLSTPEFKEKKLREEGDDIYPMKDKSSDRTRLALLINNVEFEYENNRPGAEKDESSMERLLKSLGYTVLTLRDLTAPAMRAALQDFSRREEHVLSDSCFVLLMSHGSSRGICGVSSIVNSDGEQDMFSTDELYHHLNTVNCAGLRDKPKIILIQSCRGDNDGCVNVQDSVSHTEHREKDFCCLRSSTPDTPSFRNISLGSHFFRDIVEVFNNHAHEDHIEELFRKVLKKFKEKHPCQMPCKDRTTLSGKFYLFPGL
ncbi:caspase a-like isoform X2 [Puntigrus tetrazona]|uniref:caspase a-like isoform X2 n=1 Tax=Puntigrus tetrazona TaxID=1606681 RepID=UPI001C89F580|nr:caspase a-like isoform X2 [Puntigrus tetrazona]